uniref:Uncharacterized protein n=1 Tax=Arundo donax TaxID=35708 RepID=A0A0A9EXY5_ARUDO
MLGTAATGGRQRRPDGGSMMTKCNRHRLPASLTVISLPMGDEKI